jgi:hypothetical protein
MVSHGFWPRPAPCPTAAGLTSTGERIAAMRAPLEAVGRWMESVFYVGKSIDWILWDYLLEI